MCNFGYELSKNIFYALHCLNRIIRGLFCTIDNAILVIRKTATPNLTPQSHRIKKHKFAVTNPQFTPL